MRLGLGLGFSKGGGSVNPILGLSGLESYVNFTDQSKWTFSAGVVGTAVAAIEGDDWVVSNATYDDAGNGNPKGLKMANAADHAGTDTDRTSASHTFGFVFELPAYGGSAADVFSYAGSSDGDLSDGFLNAQCFQADAGVLQYRRQENNANITVFNSGVSGIGFVVFKVTDSTDMDVFWNAIGNKIEFDPEGSGLDSFPRRRIGARTSLATPAACVFMEAFSCNEALSEADIESVLNYWGGRYSLGEPSWRLVTSLAGQSLIEQWTSEFSGAGVGAFDEAVEEYYNNALTIQGATGGSAVLEGSGTANYWWLTAGGDGNALTAYYTDISNAGLSNSEIHNTVWAQGTADCNGATFTKAGYKAALLAVFEDMKAVHADDWKVFICPYHRRTTNINDTDAIDINEVQQELISEYDWIEFGAEFYDQDLIDQTHLGEAGYEAFAERVAERIAAVRGERSTVGTLGPIISSAVASGSTVTATVTHDAGTSLSAPNGDPKAFFKIYDDGAAATINTAVISGNTIVFTLSAAIAAASEVEVVSGYGHLFTLSQTSPEVVLDNIGLPLRQGSVSFTA